MRHCSITGSFSFFDKLRMQRAARLEPGGPQSQPQAGSEPKARAPTPRPPPWGRVRVSGASAGGSRWPGAAAGRFDKPQPVRYNKGVSTGRRKLHQWERPGAERLRVFSCPFRVISRQLSARRGAPCRCAASPFPPDPLPALRGRGRPASALAGRAVARPTIWAAAPPAPAVGAACAAAHPSGGGAGHRRPKAGHKCSAGPAGQRWVAHRRPGARPSRAKRGGCARLAQCRQLARLSFGRSVLGQKRPPVGWWGLFCPRPSQRPPGPPGGHWLA